MDCKYGCGQKGIYKNKQGEWICSKYWQQCPVKRKQTSEISKRTHNTKEFKEKARINAINQFKNESFIDKQKRINNVKRTCNKKEFIETSRTRSKELWKNEKLRNQMMEGIRRSKKDPKYRKLVSKIATERFKNETAEEKLKRISIAKQKSRNYFDNETEDQRLKRIKSKKRTIEKINKKYPLFSKIEEIRYNPDRLEEKEIQVHCTYCNKWFTPSNRQIEQRIASLEKQNYDGSYFYCSDDCKVKCCLYHSKGILYNKSKFEKYIHTVYKFTERTLKKHKIENLHLRGRKFNYDLDHKYSIYDGFINDIDPKIIAHYSNIQMISATENRRKGKNSIITLTELLNNSEDM